MRFTREPINSLVMAGRSKVIAVDFDGTVVYEEYPYVGMPVPGAIETLLDIQNAGHKIVLHTMRGFDMTYKGTDMDLLSEAINYLDNKGIRLHGANICPGQTDWTDSTKTFAHYYIDDRMMGDCVEEDKNGKRVVNWERVRFYLRANDII